MRLLYILIFFALIATSVEGSELILDVSLKDGRTMYLFNGKSVTFQELDTWIQKTAALLKANNPVYVRPDLGIPFSTVFKLAQMLTSAGVHTVIIVIANDENEDQNVVRYLSISKEQLHEENFPNLEMEIVPNLKIIQSVRQLPEPK